MMVLVDTCVWSLALRRSVGPVSSEDQRVREELVSVVSSGRARLLGLVRQELLSGIRSPQQFARLRDQLRAFDDPPLFIADYEEAAQAANHCRRKGLAGSPADFLLCGVALRNGWEIFTTDRDFAAFARCLPLRLHRLLPQK